MSRKGLNIYKRKDGRWEARYIKSRNALGKPKYGYLYASSYREVRCDLQHTLQLQGKPSGSEERTRNSTFELVSMEWLDAFSINFKESTYIRYRTLIECYLMPSFQTVKIEKITKEMVRKLCKHLELHGKKDKTGLSPKTISDVLSVLRRILNYAGTLGIFVDSKVLDIRVKQTQKSLPILSLPEQMILQQYMIIVVGAAQNTGKHSSWGKCKHTGYEVTAYSNRGSRVDVLAPGGEKTIDGIPDASIYSTVPYGNGYDGLVGTSMACPHVAGVAAMIFGIDPTFTAKEVKDIIISTATGSYGSVKEQYPLLNARLAVEKAIKLSNEKAKGQTGDDLPFEPSGEHQYRIFYDALTWEEAKAACEAKGGHLATITSEEEQQKLNLYNAGNHKLWIGGYKNTEGQWCWVTGEPWEYENWGDGEPNNSSNVVAGESCVAMWPEKWNDLANSNVYEQSGYICEWEASDVAEETQVEGYTGHLYEFYTLPESEWESGPITWQQAERRCEWKGGHLAVIESSTENFLLYSAMKAKGYENAYFGYSDKSSEGNWKWVNGTSTAYTNWHSGEPNNQDGIEHYAMFYENFQDGTWNDADGIIDAGCAYICEWDDPTDKISQGDSFTDQQLRIIAKDLGVPDDLNVEIRQSPKAYWESAGLWDIYVEITHNGKLVASGSFDVETGEMGRNIYIYTPV